MNTVFVNPKAQPKRRARGNWEQSSEWRDGGHEPGTTRLQARRPNHSAILLSFLHLLWHLIVQLDYQYLNMDVQ